MRAGTNRFPAEGDFVRAAVVGYGAYGRQHARKYFEHPAARLVAVVDAQAARLREAATDFPGILTFQDPAALAGLAELASVVVPATRHRDVSRRLLAGGMHLLIEKPFTASLAAARELAAIAAACDRIVQPGYLERFNLTLRELRSRLPDPCYIEARRLTRWRGRGADVSVILDLMIHDIDMVLETVHAPIVDIQARGVRIFSDHWDVANARLRFADGCVANLTASRASPVPERRLHVFSETACVLADIDAGVMTLHQRNSERPDVMTERRFSRHEDPLAAEIDAFLRAVRNHTPPAVTMTDGCRALDVAERIAAVVEQDAEVVMRTASPLTDSRQAIAYLLRNGQSLHGR